MSTKTLRKRIALATVAALGAGVLSLVSTTAAFATAAGPNVAPGTASPAGSNDVLNIGTTTNTSGAADYTATDGSPSSVGLLAVGDLSGAGTRVAGTTQTATLLSNGTLVVYTKPASGQSALITVTGGSIVGTTNATATSSSLTSSARDYASSAVNFVVAVAPNTGATSMSVKLYTAATSSAAAADLVSGAASGTLKGQITVTIATSNAAGTVAPSKSGIYYADNSTDRGRTADTTTSVTATAKQGSTVPWNTVNYANIRVSDIYGSAITGTGKLLTATATNGALVGLHQNTGVTPTKTSAYLSGYADNSVLSVAAPTAAPLSTVVTISLDGVVVGTKAFTFTGPIAKVTLSAASRIQLTGAAAGSAKGATITFADSAGTAIYPLANDVAYPTTGILADGDNPAGSTVAYSSASSSTSAYLDWTCASGIAAHTDSVKLDYVNLDGSTVKSNAINVSCAGAQYTYTAAFDKSTYNPGDIATLSVTFKDSKGNLAADSTNFAAGTTTNAQAIAAAGGTISVAQTNSDITANGVVTYKILVGTTSGTFNTVVNYPSPTGISSSQVAQIASFTVATSGTQLNDVLKGIVDLIASINKQIAALAKLVTATKKK